MKLVQRIFLFLLGALAASIAALAAWWFFGDWQYRAERDVNFIHQTLTDHHPGTVDQENPTFLEMMEEARVAALEKAATARSPSDHHEALKAYTSTFNDGHLSAFFFDQALGMLQRNASSGLRREASLSGTGEEFWIKIGSFSESASPIAELTVEIEARANELRAAELVVFDLRGNGGGDSAFGTRIARALWGDEVYFDFVPVSAEAVDWRASVANAEHVAGIASKNRKKGRSNAEAWQRIADGILKAAENGDDFYRQQLSTRPVTRSAESPVDGTVVIVTDRFCASACLDFLDRVLSLPNTVHIGEETSSDTQYMDVRFVPLESKSGVLIFPLKVYRGRIRPAGGTYKPEIPVDASSVEAENIGEILAAPRED